MSIRLGIGIDNFASGGIDADATTIYNRIIADGGVSNLTRLNFFVKGLKTIYGSLANVPVCYDAHWIGYKLGSGTGATAGQAAAKLYSLTVAGDAVQTTAASQPLLLSHNGASSDNYWWGSGVSGNFISSPSSFSSNIRGDFEVIALGVKQFTGTSDGNIYGRFDTGQRQWIFGINNTLRVAYLSLSVDGINNLSYTSTTTIPAYNIEYSLKATRNSTNGEIKFFTSTDGLNFTQLGTTVTGVTGLLFNSTSTIQVGSYINGTIGNFNGKISRVTISNTIGGSPVVDFNPATYNASTSQTAWTSATGEVWTINTGTADGYKGLLVDRTYLQGDGIDDVMITTSLASRQFYSSYVATRIQTFSGNVRGILGSVGQRNLIYVNTTGDVRGIAVGILQYAGEVNNRFQLFTANFELLAGSVLTNNANKVSGALGGVLNTSAYVLSDGSTGFGNFVFSTGIQSNATDSIATNTATYNLIRSLNNNAF
jgi:hypothetical protein